MNIELNAGVAKIEDSLELQNCAREPIHQIQTIQPHGFLVACERASGRITFVSENIQHYLQPNQISFIGQPVFELLKNEPGAALALLAGVSVGPPLLIDLQFRFGEISGEHFEVVAHRIEASIVIEAMPFHTAPKEFTNENSQIESMVKGVGELHRQKSMEGFLHSCVSQIQQLSGYQRVFIYRFLPDWSGEVIAESTAAGCGSRFLGLRFPASDIPEQARALYRTNLLRIIGDVDATAIPLLSTVASAPLDQSNSLLRSPSPVHLRYLQNMGVKATMTISLLKDGELWGMVSCHHNVPLVPPVELRRMTSLLCALLAEVAVLRLDAVLRQEITNKTLCFRDAMTQLIREVGSGDKFPLNARKALADVSTAMKVGGFGLMIAGQWIYEPSVDTALLEFLLSKARGLTSDTVFSTSCLNLESKLPSFPERLWAGALVLQVPGTSDSFLILLRKEVTQEVMWGGAPGKESIELANGIKILEPRQSFESWTEVMHGRGEIWSEEEQMVVLDVARTLGDAQLAYSRQVLQAELRMLGSCMEHLNDIVIVTLTASFDEPNPTIIYVNEAFVSKTGYSREEAIGRSPRFLQGPGSDRAQLDVLRNAMRDWRPVTVELINYCKNGEPFWVELSLAPIAGRNDAFTHWVAIERSIDERKDNEITLRKLADFDVLTGLPNRRLLMGRLPLALSASKRYGRNGALLFIDLDNFKDLNDIEGHNVGDELLKQVAQRLLASVRLEDMVARLGGDEFVIMLENLSAEINEAAASAQQLAEKVICGLSQPYDLPGHSYSNTASLGISLFCDSNGDQSSVEEMFKQADFAMYQSKSAGRNTWRFFDPKTQAQLVEKNALESDLKKAFAENHLNLYYQPIVDANRTVVGTEALLRWQHKTRGWVSPAEFIPIAEHSGLIVPIGKWAIAQACAMLKSWSLDPLRLHWSIAVNVSAPQVRQSDFVAIVKNLVANSGCDGAHLKLELTESILQHDVDATIGKIEALRDIGVTFSIDDFGTGYSSLAYLQRLPISVLKIDSSFVRNVVGDAGDRAICMMILALGKTLGLSVVAEGVETEDQFDFLRSHQCDLFQGFRFSKAVPPNELNDVAAAIRS